MKRLLWIVVIAISVGVAIPTLNLVEAYEIENNFKSEIGEYNYEQLKQRIRILNEWMARQEFRQKMRDDVAFIMRYERLLRWVEDNRLTEPALSEAREVLRRDLNKFIESNQGILEKLRSLVPIMEKLEILGILADLQPAIKNALKSPEIGSFVTEEEYKLLKRIEVTSYKFQEMIRDYDISERPIRYRDLERLNLNTENMKNMSSEPAKWKKLVISMGRIAGGLGLVVLDAPAASVVLGIVSISMGTNIMWMGIRPYLE